MAAPPMPPVIAPRYSGPDSRTCDLTGRAWPRAPGRGGRRDHRSGPDRGDGGRRRRRRGRRRGRPGRTWGRYGSGRRRGRDRRRRGTRRLLAGGAPGLLLRHDLILDRGQHLGRPLLDRQAADRRAKRDRCLQPILKFRELALEAGCRRFITVRQVWQDHILFIARHARAAGLERLQREGRDGRLEVHALLGGLLHVLCEARHPLPYGLPDVRRPRLRRGKLRLQLGQFGAVVTTTSSKPWSPRLCPARGVAGRPAAGRPSAAPPRDLPAP